MTVANVIAEETRGSKSDDITNITEIVAIVDRSGSMASVLDEAISGFNAFLSQQQAAGPAWFTLVLFNDRCQTICSGINIRYAAPLDQRTYVPSGNTALYDAVGRGINDVLVRITDYKSKVIFAILTDGHENSSLHYTKHEIRSMITMCKEAG